MVEKNRQYEWSSSSSSESVKQKNKKNRRRLSNKDVVAIISQFTNMLHSGLSIIDIFECLAEENNSKLRGDVLIWKGEVARGKPLHMALNAGTTLFPSTLLTVVKTGEETGQLPEALGVYVRELKRIDSTERKMRSAITYPSIVIGVSVILLVVLFTIALPKLETMFTAVNVPPKGIAAVIFGMGRFLSGIGTKPLLILAVIFDIWLFSPAGKGAVIRFFSFIPAVRKIMDLSAWGIFSAQLGIALNAGLSVVHSFEIARENAPKTLGGSTYDLLLNGIVQGKSLLEIPNVEFPPYIKGYIRVAERTGGLAEAFASISEYYSNEVNEKISTFSQSVEPILMLIVISVVGMVPVAVIKAMSDMYVAVLSTVAK